MPGAQPTRSEPSVHSFIVRIHLCRKERQLNEMMYKLKRHSLGGGPLDVPGRMELLAPFPSSSSSSSDSAQEEPDVRSPLSPFTKGAHSSKRGVSFDTPTGSRKRLWRRRRRGSERTSPERDERTSKADPPSGKYGKLNSTDACPNSRTLPSF